MNFKAPHAFHPYCGDVKYAVSYLHAITFQVPNTTLNFMSDLRTGIFKRTRIVDIFNNYEFVQDKE